MGTLQNVSSHRHFSSIQFLPTPHQKPSSPTNFGRFCTSSVDLGSTRLVFHGRSCKKNSRVRVSDSQLKENWLDSLSCPFMEKGSHLGFDGDEADNAAACECVIGIDPDISGALAVLKGDGVGFSAQDDSRKAASALFPSLSSLLKRKKDHGTLLSPISWLTCEHFQVELRLS